MPDAPEAKVRARAGSIGFSGERADTPVANLSGGEKARLLLGLATFAGPHLIILDEPTNHLDIDSRAALIEAINDYPGAAILVSHDRYLIEACADRLWLVGEGTVAPYEGDLDDYRQSRPRARPRARGEERERPDNKVSRTDQRRAAAEKREELKPLKRRIDAAEKAVAKLTAEIATIDAQLASDLFARDPAKATALVETRAKPRTRSRKRRKTGSQPAPSTKRRWRNQRHCEERSDEAIRIQETGLLRFARNDEAPSRAGSVRGLLDSAIKLFCVVAQRAARDVARIEHVPAAIDRQLEPLGGSERRQLVDDHLVLEIGRDEVARPVRHQHAQARIGGQDRAQIADDLMRGAAAAPVPARVHPAVEQLIRLLDAPFEHAGRRDRSSRSTAAHACR